MPRFSANLTFLFTESPFLDRFGEAAQAGFRAVEFAFPVRLPGQGGRGADGPHKLDVVLINTPPGDYEAGDRGVASLSGREHEFAASVVTPALRRDAALPAPARDGGRAARRRRRGGAREPAAHVRPQSHVRLPEAAEQNVTVLIEPINPRDMPRYLLSTQADAHAIRDGVGAPNLKVQMDLYHAQIVEGDLTEKLKRWLPHIGHIQIAGVPGRHEPDVGEVNYEYLFKVLDELKYDGWVGCEYKPATTTAAGLTWLYRLLDRKRSAVGNL